MSHPNQDLLRGAYGMRNQGEVFGARDLLRDDVVWHTLNGDVHGVEGVLAMLAQSDKIASGTISREVHALFANDDYGMVLVTVRAERHGRRLRTARCTSIRCGTGGSRSSGCSRAIGRLVRSSGPSDR
jgi:hypothetical protein